MTRYKSQDRFYYNLHKETFSVQEKVNGRWKVNKERYSNKIIVDNPTFEVSEAGRQRVLRDKQKNVHAYVVGNECNREIDKSQLIEATYNPYKYSSFVIKATGQAIESAKLALLENKRIFVQL